MQLDHQQLTEIARLCLGIDTLETQNSDALDFHELAVWAVKSALEAAYEAGRQSLPGRVEIAPLPSQLRQLEERLASVAERLERDKCGWCEEPSWAYHKARGELEVLTALRSILDAAAERSATLDAALFRALVANLDMTQAVLEEIHQYEATLGQEDQ